MGQRESLKRKNYILLNKNKNTEYQNMRDTAEVLKNLYY